MTMILFGPGVIAAMPVNRMIGRSAVMHAKIRVDGTWLGGPQGTTNVVLWAT
jgi:hypothetical protein